MVRLKNDKSGDGCVWVCVTRWQHWRGQRVLFRCRGFKTSNTDHPACLCPSVRPSDRYLGKEGWAPASYLKKVKEDFSSPRKKTLTGPVEIIGNIMEISNLLNNKKPLSEKETVPPPPPSLPEESPLLARRQISLPLPCTEPITNVTGVTATTACPTMPPPPLLDAKSKAEPSSPTQPASPAIARIAPHRVEIGTW